MSAARMAIATVSVAAMGCMGCGAPLRTFGSDKEVVRPLIAVSSPDEAFGQQGSVFTKGEVFHGELVACDMEFVYLFVNDRGHPWTMVPWTSVTSAETRGPSGGARPSLIAWTVVGSISTISHGFWAVLTAPLWISVGVPSVFWAKSQEGMRGKCEELRPYTRYPQGLPPTMRGLYWGDPRMPPAPGIPPGMVPAPMVPPGAPVPSSPAPPSSAPPSSAPPILPPGAAPTMTLPPRPPAPPSGAPEPLPVMPPLPPSAPVPAPGVGPR